MKIRVAQIGARKSYAVPQVLGRLGLLERLCTDVYCDGPISSAILGVLPLVGLGRHAESLRGRKCPGVSRRQVRSFPVFGLFNRRAVSRATRAGRTHEVFLRGSSLFSKKVAAIPFTEVEAVYAFSSAALEIFQAAKLSGVTCVLDHETAPAELEMALVQDVEQRFAKWLSYEPQQTSATVHEYTARQREEAELADLVICPSTFSAELMHQDGLAREKIEVLPFAMGDHFVERNSAPRARSPNEPLRVLFVGNDAIRKGLPVLVDALAQLPEGTATAKGAGSWSLSEFGWNAVRQVLDPLDAVPRTQIAKLYEWADVFVLPTFSDTMGVVILEAMACGVPVITTTNSGGPDLIRHEIDGYVIPINDSASITELLQTLHADRTLLADLSTRAVQRAAEFNLQQYSRGLRAILRKHVSQTRTGVSPKS